jgi:hypothetical protein
MTTPQGSDTKTQTSAKLSTELKSFYESHNVHGVEELFRDSKLRMVRFIRLNPRHDKVETLSLLEVSLLEKKWGWCTALLAAVVTHTALQ